MGKSRLTDPWPVVLCFSRMFPGVLVSMGGCCCTSNQKNRSGVNAVEVKIMKFLALWNIKNPQLNAQLTDRFAFVMFLVHLDSLLGFILGLRSHQTFTGSFPHPMLGRHAALWGALQRNGPSSGY